MRDAPRDAVQDGVGHLDLRHQLQVLLLPARVHERHAIGGKAERLILEQSAEAIHEWAARMRERFGGRPVAVCIETSRGAAISALMMHEFIVLFTINPKALKSYRAAFCVSGAKDDRTDAMLLEEYVRLHQDKLKALEPDTELTRSLAGLVELRRQLVDDRTRLVEQLHSTLKIYYPLAETLLGRQLTTPMAADFLARHRLGAQLDRFEVQPAGYFRIGYAF